MYTLRILKIVFMVGLVSVIGLTVSCTSDGEEIIDELSELGDISLSFTLDGTQETAVFESGSVFLAIDAGDISVVSSSGRLASGLTYGFATSFDGNSTGSFTLTRGAGSEDEIVSGLSLAIVDGNNSQSYSASNVTLTITSYRVISLAQIIIEGTFSGTLVNDETQETASITNGSFRTGFKD